MTNDPRRDIRRLERIGYAAVALFVFGAGGWAATTELSGAVIGAGTVVVESNLKKVQHPTGGIVGALFVKEGSAVEAGQVVMRLDETVTRVGLALSWTPTKNWIVSATCDLDQVASDDSARDQERTRLGVDARFSF